MENASDEFLKVLQTGKTVNLKDADFDAIEELQRSEKLKSIFSEKVDDMNTTDFYTYVLFNNPLRLEFYPSETITNEFKTKMKNMINQMNEKNEGELPNSNLFQVPKPPLTGGRKSRRSRRSRKSRKQRKSRRSRR